jgi:plastocyanin
MFQRRLTAIGILVGGLVVFAACGGGGGDGGGGPGSGDPVIAKATGNNGNGQSGTVGQALTDSFRVVVTQDGSAKAGVTVSWTSQAQGVSLSPTSSLTDAQGRAASRMMAGTLAGSQTAKASLGSANTVFAVTIAPGPPSNLGISSGDNQAALVNTAAQFPLKVQVTDQFANVLAGSPVAWSLASGSGSVTPSTLTDAGGLAATTLTVGGSAEALVIRAVSAGNDTVLFTAHSVSLVKDVLVKNNFFLSGSNGSAAPSVDTVSVGQGVRWIWQPGAADHNIIPQGSPLFQGISGSISAPFTFGPAFFGSPGTYQYDCNLHAGMSGIVVVE